jgi:hypothetical protein
MARALDDGNGMCSFVHDTISLLVASPRPGIGALDREADPAASWQVIPWRRARAADGTRSVEEESQPCASLVAAVSLGSLAGPARARWRDPPHCGDDCSRDPRTIWIGRSKSEGMTENAPEFAQWRPPRYLPAHVIPGGSSCVYSDYRCDRSSGLEHAGSCHLPTGALRAVVPRYRGDRRDLLSLHS